MLPHRPGRAVRWLLSLVFLVGIVAAQHALQQQPAAVPAALPIPPHDWPMLGRTPSRMPVQLRTGKLPESWDIKTNKNVKWSVAVGSQAYGGPVVAGGKIFVGTNNGAPRNPAIRGDKGVLMCFRESDGAFLWQLVHDKLPSGRVNDWPEQGVCSTPTVDGNRLYYLSNRCELFCVDVEGMDREPRILWQLDLMKTLGVFPHNMAASAPLVIGNHVFVVTGNGHDESHDFIPAPDAPSFLAVDKYTGKVVWHDNSPGKNILHGQWAAPTLLEVNGQQQVLMPGGDGWLRAFNPLSGTLLWKFDCNPKDSVYKLGGKGTRNELIAPAVVHQGKVYIATGQDPEHGDGVGHLWCIDPSKAHLSNIDLSPRDKHCDPLARVNRDSGLVWYVGGTYPVVNQGKAEQEMRFRRSLSMCAIVDDMLFVATYTGMIYCLEVHTGRQHWVYDTLSNIWGSPTIAGDKVYVSTEEGDVYVFAASRFCTRLAVNDMESSIANASPVVANNTLYILTKNRLYALTEQQKK